MKSTDIVQPQAMPSVFGEDIYSAEGSINFEIPDATSTSASDTCVMDNGFLPITSEPLDDGGIAPERKNFNGLFYLSTDQRVFLQNGGFITYNSAVASAIGGYPEGAILGYIDSNNQFMLVQSLIDDNTNNFTQNPSLIDNINWKVALNFADVDLANTAPAQSFIDKSVGWGMPDYTAGISIALTNDTLTSYTPSQNGYIRLYRGDDDGVYYIRLFLGNTQDTVIQNFAGSTQFNTGYSYSYIPVLSGQQYSLLTNNTTVCNAVFYPMKGDANA